MTDEQSHRFAITGSDPRSGNRTVILWRESDLTPAGKVVHRVVVTLDATMTTATVLTCPQAVELGHALLTAGTVSVVPHQGQ